MGTLLAVGPFLLEISSNERLARWWMPLEVKTTWGFAKMRPLAHAAAGANSFIARYFQQNGALRCARWFMGAWGAGCRRSAESNGSHMRPSAYMPETSADDPAIVRSQIPVPFEWHQNFACRQKNEDPYERVLCFVRLGLRQRSVCGFASGGSIRARRLPGQCANPEIKRQGAVRRVPRFCAAAQNSSDKLL